MPKEAYHMDQVNPDQYPRVTKAQLQIWEADPTTQKYFQCLKWMVEQSKEYLGSGDWVSRDADEVLATTSTLLGIRDGLTTAIDYKQAFKLHEMLEIDKETTDGA
jgi:hypothetical protein